MSEVRNRSFGATLRSLREKKEIGLRKFAKMVGISPTYLSKIERDEFKPPSEDKILTIAKVLEQNPDELLALAGKTPSDLDEIIQSRPKELADFLRAAKGLSASAIRQLTKEAEQQRKSSK